jgi:hypothetical protein
MDRRLFLASVAVLLSLPNFAQAGAAAVDAQKFIGNLAEANWPAPGSVDSILS